ncbi:MAK10-like protein [Tanacetum coccineum]
MVPLRSDTIRLVQNRCSFHRLRSEDLNQHLKDFIKLVDSLDLDGENRERTRFLLFQFSLRDQASNWLERLPAGSITTWEDLTTHFLAQFIPPRRTVKLRNDIMMRLRKIRPDEAWDTIERLAQYENEGWNDAFTPDEYCMEDPEQAFIEYASSHTDEAGDASQSKFEADFKRQQGEITNKIDIVLKAITNRIADTIPSDTVKNPKLGTHLVLSARSYPTEDPQSSTHIHSSINAITIHPKQPEESQVNEPDVRKLNSTLKSLRLVPQSSNTRFACTKEEDGEVMFIEIIRDDDEPQNKSPNEGEGTTTEGPVEEYFDTLPIEMS